MIPKRPGDGQDACAAAAIVIRTGSGCSWSAGNIDGIEMASHDHHAARLRSLSNLVGDHVETGVAVHRDGLQTSPKSQLLKLLPCQLRCRRIVRTRGEARGERDQLI